MTADEQGQAVPEVGAASPRLQDVIYEHRYWHAILHCGCTRDDENADTIDREEHAAHVAQVWREACMIRTVEQLAALPEQSVVRNIAWGVTFERVVQNDGTVQWWSPAGLRQDTVMLPALLVWSPDWEA
ncbi:MAG: hypothetical protein PGN37_20545 [Mycobacterium kyogaense]|uniref:hypothetical protein n=1 Tax=Mycobacterium kyogaense TaxID=2212479 RepID=UPI002FFB4A2E